MTPDPVVMQADSGSGTAGVRALEARLAEIRSRARWWLVARAVAIIVAGVVLAVTVGAAVDYVLRTPGWLRTVAWVGGVAGLAFAVRRVLLPAWGFEPSLTETALRLERSPAGARAGLGDRLASALELGRAETGGSGGALVRRLVDDTLERSRVLTPAAVLAPSEPRRVVWAGAAAVALAALLALVQPGLAGIGLARLVAPWAGAEWPKRTAVVDATDAGVHPADEALALRAALQRSPWAEGRTEVVARYRVRMPGADVGAVRRVVLSSQGREGGAEVFERLIELPATVRDGSEVEYWFETVDDRTGTARVRIATRPELEELRAVFVPPAYAEGAEGLAAFPREVTLRPGAEGPASVGPVLAGSSAEVKLRFNKPVAASSVRIEAEGDHGLSVAPASDAGRGREGDDARWGVAGVAIAPATLLVQARDAQGLGARSPVVVALGVAVDEPPIAGVIEPARDESVLATARIGVRAEGRDEVGLTWVRVEAQRLAPPSSSPGGAPEAVGAPAVIGSWARDGAAPMERTVMGELALDALGARAGDEVVLWAVAADVRDPEAEARSAPRRLRIIEPTALIDQLRSELQAVRRAAIELDRLQAQTQHKTGLTGATAETSGEQASIGERLGSPLETVRELAARASRNGLGDAALDDLLGAGAELLDAAQRDAREAAAELAALQAGEQADARRTEAAEQAQQRVRDRLGELISALDRGEDGWAARREVERLLAEQRELASRTGEAGRDTAGAASEDLSPAQRDALERLAERQEELARRADDAAYALRQRAEELERRDPATAQAMREAAARARQERVGDQLQQAARDIGQNRTQSAQQAQEQAIEALEEMLEDLDGAERNRDEALRRVLASLIESIEGLIEQQRAELAALAAVGPEGLAALDAGMIRLNRNTLGVLEDQARQEDVVREVGAQLAVAAEQQSGAIAGLRSGDGGVAQAGEAASLSALQAARDAAREQDQQAAAREADRARRELRSAYREFLEEQVMLREQAGAFEGRDDLDRRERAMVRAVGDRQDALRTRLAELRDRTAAIEDTIVFSLAHERLDAVTQRAASGLREGAASPATLRAQDSAVRLLQSLVEALKDAPQPQEFDQGAGGGSGGGGGGGQGQGEEPVLPPLAELRLLRGMQGEAAAWTRAVAEADVSDATELRELGELQRELAERGVTLIQQLAEQQAPAADTGGGGS